MIDMNLIEIKQYEALAGSDIKVSIKEAIEIAQSQSCFVEFGFNGVVLRVYQFSDEDDVYKEYRKKLDNNFPSLSYADKE
jgi:hypothetical protein